MLFAMATGVGVFINKHDNLQSIIVILCGLRIKAVPPHCINFYNFMVFFGKMANRVLGNLGMTTGRISFALGEV